MLVTRTDTLDPGNHNEGNLQHEPVTHASIIPDGTTVVEKINIPAHETANPIYEETLAHHDCVPPSQSVFNMHIDSINVALKKLNPNETPQPHDDS